MSNIPPLSTNHSHLYSTSLVFSTSMCCCSYIIVTSSTCPEPWITDHYTITDVQCFLLSKRHTPGLSVSPYHLWILTSLFTNTENIESSPKNIWKEILQSVDLTWKNRVVNYEYFSRIFIQSTFQRASAGY